MDVRAFRNSPAGRLVSSAAGWAFVPHPLPPRLTMDVVLQRQVAAAGRAVGELACLHQSLADPELFVPPFIQREAAFSSRLAKRAVHLSDLYACRADGPGFASWALEGNEDDLREALRLAQTLERADQRLPDTAINLRLIRELHAQLQGRQSRSEFRQTHSWIGAPDSGPQAAEYVPPPPEELQLALNKMETYLADASAAQPDPIVRLAFITYQFEAIHPFLDGNGRVGRLLLALLPCRWGLLPHPMLTMSAHFARSQPECDERLLTVSRDGDWRGWVSYFVQGVESQARDGLRRMNLLHRVHLAYHSRLEQMLSDPARPVPSGGYTLALKHRLPDRLLERPILTVSGLQVILGVNRLNTERAAQYLVDAGVLTPLAPATSRASGPGPRPPLYAAIELLNAMTL